MQHVPNRRVPAGRIGNFLPSGLLESPWLSVGIGTNNGLPLHRVIFGGFRFGFVLRLVKYAGGGVSEHFELDDTASIKRPRLV